MGKFKFGIASFDRPDKQYLLGYLRGLGYGADDVIISTQCEKDYYTYREKFGKQAIVIYNEGRNVCENKNNLLRWYNGNVNDDNTRLVLCSDKVRSIMYLGRDGRLHPMGREELDFFLEHAFSASRQLGAAIFGTYPVKNAFFMSHTTHINQFILGCFMGILNPKETYFDAQQPLKEDWEIMARTIANGGRVVRFNDIALDATFRTKGGCSALWNKQGKNTQCTERLLGLYPRLLARHNTRKDELKYIGETQRINKSIFEI